MVGCKPNGSSRPRDGLKNGMLCDRARFKSVLEIIKAIELLGPGCPIGEDGSAVSSRRNSRRKSAVVVTLSVANGKDPRLLIELHNGRTSQ